MQPGSAKALDNLQSLDVDVQLLIFGSVQPAWLPCTMEQPHCSKPCACKARSCVLLRQLQSATCPVQSVGWRCRFLGPCSLAALSCTCRAFHQLSSSPQGQLSLWKSLCCRRWLALNAHLFPSQTAGGTDFKRLYGEGNAWAQQQEAGRTLSPGLTSTEVACELRGAQWAQVAVLHSAVDPASLGFGSLEGTTILTTLWGDLRTVSLPAGGQPTVLATSHHPLQLEHADIPFMDVHNLAESGGSTPLAAVGPKGGATQIHRLQQTEPGTPGHWQPVWSIACPPR